MKSLPTQSPLPLTALCTPPQSPVEDVDANPVALLPPGQDIRARQTQPRAPHTAITHGMVTGEPQEGALLPTPPGSTLPLPSQPSHPTTAAGVQTWLAAAQRRQWYRLRRGGGEEKLL